MDDVDLDRAMELGWARFLTQLGDHLAQLDEPLVITPRSAAEPSDAPLPAIAVTVEADQLRAELDVTGDLGDVDLAALGWEEEDGAHVLVRPRAHCDYLASVVVQTLRTAMGVPHPAFLDAGPLSLTAPIGAEEGAAGPEAGEDDGQVPPVELDTAVVVSTPAELQQVVDRTLHAAFRRPPRHDPDGDVPISFGSALVFVRPSDNQPLVTIFAIAVQDIGDLEAARREVEILNRRSVFIRFRLADTQIVAVVALPAYPFVPRHLLSMIEMVGREIDALDEDLALRVSGRRWIDVVFGQPRPALGPGRPGEGGAGAGTGVGARTRTGLGRSTGDAEDALPPELETLLQLAAEGTGPLDPVLVADVCHHDRDLILRLIRMAEERTINCQESVDEARMAGDADEARAVAGELRGWESTLHDLRAALRQVVTFHRGAQG